MHVVHAGHVGHVGRGEETGYDVTQHYGLFETLEEERHGTCTNEDKGKVSDEGFEL